MGYSQKDVAKVFGYKCTSRISQWEKGLSMPSAMNLLRLSLLYGVLMDQLYFDLREELKEEVFPEKERLGKEKPP